jgi:hypothetical protein
MMGQIPGQLTNLAKQAGQAIPAVATQAGRIAFHPVDVESQSAENRFVPNYGDWPLKDYGYKTPLPQVPDQWYKDAPPQNRGMSAKKPIHGTDL